MFGAIPWLSLSQITDQSDCPLVMCLPRIMRKLQDKSSRCKHSHLDNGSSTTGIKFCTGGDIQQMSQHLVFWSAGFVCDFGRHMTKRRFDWLESGWPELCGITRAKESAQRYQTTLSVDNLLADMVGGERDCTISSSQATCVHR